MTEEMGAATEYERKFRNSLNRSLKAADAIRDELADPYAGISLGSGVSPELRESLTQTVIAEKQAALKEALRVSAKWAEQLRCELQSAVIR